MILCLTIIIHRIYLHSINLDFELWVSIQHRFLNWNQILIILWNQHKVKVVRLSYLGTVFQRQELPFNKDFHLQQSSRLSLDTEIHKTEIHLPHIFRQLISQLVVFHDCCSSHILFIF